MIRVVGIDMSLTSTGVARATVDDDGRVSTATEVVDSAPASSRSLFSRWQRLDYLADRVVESVAPSDGGVRADLVLIESPTYAAQVTGSSHDRAGLWWLICDQLVMACDELAEVHTTHLKIYATGKGARVGKAAVIAGVRATWGHLFDLPAAGKGLDDIADAVTLAALGCAVLGQPLAPLPDERARAVDMTKLRKG